MVGWLVLENQGMVNSWLVAWLVGWLISIYHMDYKSSICFQNFLGCFQATLEVMCFTASALQKKIPMCYIVIWVFS